MTKSSVIVPWKDTCKLRPEIRERKLTASDFAVDLHKVIFGFPGGETPYYCDPRQFFSTTYATQNLRQFCKAVLRRLAKQNGGEAIINVSQTFGGGKSHTLTALYYLTTLGPKLPRDETSVGMILNEAQMKDPPKARIAAVSFDKVDWKVGGEVRSPEGEIRTFRMPWNLIAWQLLGEKGLNILQRDEAQADYDTPPSDALWTKILQEVETSGHGALILIDEFLMWAHDAASPDPTGESKKRGAFWYDRLKNFFQKLAQAVESSGKSCLVVSLLATEPEKNDEVGKSILDACNGGLGRQASIQSPVEKDDLAELLRRRMFVTYPENETDRHKFVLAFWPRMQAVEPIRAKMPDSEDRLKKSYPFHPDLLDRFFGKWVDLHQFQRTRGVLQTFAMALRDAESWDNAPIIGSQVFLSAPGQDGLSEALLKLAHAAKDSVAGPKSPPWPENLKTELPRALEAQKADAPTLLGREIEAACIASFIFSQPVGEQAELSELRWLLGTTCDMPAVLNAGLIAWARNSWYLEECETTEAGTGVPKAWRLGPKPNLNQLHDSYKRQAMNHARAKFDELARTKCPPLLAGCLENNVKPHNLPSSPSEVEDDGQFRLVVIGADYAGVIGDPPNQKAVDFIRTHSSPADQRTYQNIILVATPSVTGLHQAEQKIADWLAWGEIKGSGLFKEMDTFQQGTVKTREKETLQEAQGAVKNAYELVLFLHTDGSIHSRKITIGAQSLIAALLLEKELRLFREKMDATALMPGGPYKVWPPSDNSIPIKDLYLAFGQQAALPKLLNRQVVLNTIEEAVVRGVLALRCMRSDGSEQWYWRSRIDMVDWEQIAEAWLPQEAKLSSLSPSAVAPDALPGLWLKDDQGVRLSDLYGWFNGKHFFEEQTLPEYPPELRPIPSVDYKIVQAAVSSAISSGALWLVYGNESIFKEKPSAIQLDPDALLYRPPQPLAAIDFLPSSLPDVWTSEEEPKADVETLFAGIKAVRGKPWPEKLFLDSLNNSIGQGYIHLASGTGPISSLQQDRKRGLVIKSSAPPPPPPPPPGGGRRKTNMITLNIADVQTLSDEIHQLTKLLAGCDPVVEACISIKPKEGVDLKAVEEVLKTIKDDWKF